MAMMPPMPVAKESLNSNAAPTAKVEEVDNGKQGAMDEQKMQKMVDMMPVEELQTLLAMIKNKLARSQGGASPYGKPIANPMPQQMA